MTMRRACAIAAACATLAALSACGGGGGDGGEDGSNASLQGYWVDDTSASVITSDNEVWGIDSGGSELLLQHSQLATAGTSYSGSLDVFRLSANGKKTFQTSGTFVPRSSVTGNTVVGSTTSPYTLRYDAAYERPATLAQAVGTWQNTVVVGTTTSQHVLTVASSGQATLLGKSWTTGKTPTTSGCTTTGTLTPDPAGGNFYRFAGKMASTGCNAPNASVRGYATVSATASGPVLLGGILWNGEGMPFALKH